MKQSTRRRAALAFVLSLGLAAQAATSVGAQLPDSAGTTPGEAVDTPVDSRVIPEPVKDTLAARLAEIGDRRVEPDVAKALADTGGRARLIVELSGKDDAGKAEAAATFSRGELAGKVVRDLGFGMVLVEADQATVDALVKNPAVIHVQVDEVLTPNLADANTILGTPTLHSALYNGSGRNVAVLDTGASTAQTDITSAIVAEACFSNNTSCPGGTSTATGAGSSAPCQWSGTIIAGCEHGTYVSGDVISRDSTYKGTAPAAGLVSVRVSDATSATTVGATSSTVISALNWLNTNTNSSGIFTPTGQPLDAVNMSFTATGAVFAYCDSSSIKPGIDTLLAKQITTFVSAGNDSSATGIGGNPACISTAVTVGATDKSNAYYPVSNGGPLLDFYAPGVNIISPDMTGSGNSPHTGTSMASPVLAGAFSSLRDKYPTTEAKWLLELMGRTGTAMRGKTIPNVANVTGQMVGSFRPITPYRVFDSRNFSGPPIVGGSALLIPGIGTALGVLPYQVAGVQLNITSVNASAVGYVNAWEAGATAPSVSMLSVPNGNPLSLSVSSKLRGSDNGLWINFTGGLTHVIIDVVGYWPETGWAGTSVRPNWVAPARIGDTRYNTGGLGTTPIPGAYGYRTLAALGTGGIPGSGVDSLILNVTAHSATAAGFLVLKPACIGWPASSNINFDAGETIANQVIVKVGCSGWLDIGNGGPGGSSAHAIVDVVGYIPTTGATAHTAMSSPVRVMDSRGAGTGNCPSTGGSCAGAFSWTGRSVQVAGVGGIPANAKSVAVNITAPSAAANSFLAVYPANVGFPGTANLNVMFGDTVANMAVVGLDSNGRLNIYGEGLTDGILDVLSYST